MVSLMASCDVVEGPKVSVCRCANMYYMCGSTIVGVWQLIEFKGIRCSRDASYIQIKLFAMIYNHHVYLTHIKKETYQWDHILFHLL